jgi:hypothetical protein
MPFPGDSPGLHQAAHDSIALLLSITLFCHSVLPSDHFASASIFSCSLLILMPSPVFASDKGISPDKIHGWLTQRRAKLKEQDYDPARSTSIASKAARWLAVECDVDVGHESDSWESFLVIRVSSRDEWGAAERAGELLARMQARVSLAPGRLLYEPMPKAWVAGNWQP